MNVRDRDAIGFLTSRGFAIFLLAASVAVLALWANYPALYTPYFLILPFLLLLSLTACTVKRVADSRGRGGVRFWASVAFHLGLILGVLVMLLSPLTRYSGTLTVIEGETAEAGAGSDAKFAGPYLGSAPPFFSLRLDGYKEEYEDGFFPVDYRADVTLGFIEGDEYVRDARVLKINGPIVFDGYKLLLESGGFMPYFILRREGRIVFEGFVRLAKETRVEDSFEIEQEGLTVRTRFFPDLFVEGGKAGTRSMEAKNPAYGVKVVRRDAPNDYLYIGVIKPGAEAAFGELTLELAEIKPFVDVLAVRDPMYYWFFAGWGVGLAGLVIRYMPDRVLRLFMRKGGGPSGGA